MKEITWMTDYLPVRLLAMAQKSERAFEERLMKCPREGQVIKIDDRDDFTQLLERRVDSVLLSTAAFEAYLGYYAHQTAMMVPPEETMLTLEEYMEQKALKEFFRDQPTRIKRRHELLLEENGDRPLLKFLDTLPMDIYQKLVYLPLIRAGKLIDYKDGNLKKIIKILSLRDEILNPGLTSVYKKKAISDSSEVTGVFLHHPVPGNLTPGKSLSDSYVVEPYGEEHFYWELLHVYPDRAVQDAIQYLHQLDGSENHFIVATCMAELVDEKGECITEPKKKYIIDLKFRGVAGE